MNSWRDELQDVIKTRAEREAEEQERHRKRIAEALEVADRTLVEAVEALSYANARLAEKGQTATLSEQDGVHRLSFHDIEVVVDIDREAAVMRVRYHQGKPREFDFATDRHITPKDVQEYVGRRLVEMVRKAQKEHPW